jgi:hypothetical protein
VKVARNHGESAKVGIGKCRGAFQFGTRSEFELSICDCGVSFDVEVGHVIRRASDPQSHDMNGTGWYLC